MVNNTNPKSPSDGTAPEVPNEKQLELPLENPNDPLPTDDE